MIKRQSVIIHQRKLNSKYWLNPDPEVNATSLLFATREVLVISPFFEGQIVAILFK